MISYCNTGRGKTSVEHGQPGFTLHGRFRHAVCERNQVADGDYPPSSRLLGGCSPQTDTLARPAAQSSVQCGERTGPTQAAGDLDGGPRGRCGATLADSD